VAAGLNPEWASAKRGPSLAGDAVDICAARPPLADLAQEGVERLRISLDFNHDPAGAILDEAEEIEATGPIVTKGPKADALNDDCAAFHDATQVSGLPLGSFLTRQNWRVKHHPGSGDWDVGTQNRAR
jgi:hypothetical protein